MTRSHHSRIRRLRAAALAAAALGALGASPVWAGEPAAYRIVAFKDSHVVLYAAKDDAVLCHVPTEWLVKRLAGQVLQPPCELPGASTAQPAVHRLRRRDRSPVEVSATREGDRLVFAIGGDEVAVAAAAVQYQPAAALALPDCTTIAGAGRHASVRGSGAEDPRCR